MTDLVHSGRNFCQVLAGAGDSELDLVADALLWTSGGGCGGDAEEQAEQQNPEGVGTGPSVHLRGTATASESFTLLDDIKYIFSVISRIFCLFILSIRSIFFYYGSVHNGNTASVLLIIAKLHIKFILLMFSNNNVSLSGH